MWKNYGIQLMRMEMERLSFMNCLDGIKRDYQRNNFPDVFNRLAAVCNASDSMDDSTTFSLDLSLKHVN